MVLMEILMSWMWMMQILIMMPPLVIMEKAKKVLPMRVAWSWSLRRVYMTSIYYFWISIVFTLLSFRFVTIPHPMPPSPFSPIISFYSLSLLQCNVMAIVSDLCYFVIINAQLILQEYNICFTTVERSVDGVVPRLPSSKTTGVLPEVLSHQTQ